MLIRYCAPCGLAFRFRAIGARESACPNCKAKLPVVDTYELLRELGRRTKPEDRVEALEEAVR